MPIPVRVTLPIACFKNIMPLVFHPNSERLSIHWTHEENRK